MSYVHFILNYFLWNLRLFYFYETQYSVSLPSKTSENCKLSELFSGLRKGTLAQYGLKYQLKIIIENTLAHSKCLMLLFWFLVLVFFSNYFRSFNNLNRMTAFQNHTYDNFLLAFC